MKRLRVNTKDATHDELVRIAKNCGFVIIAGSRHDKIKTVDDKFISLIPRHNKIKRELVKGIVEAFIRFGADITFN